MSMDFPGQLKVFSKGYIVKILDVRWVQFSASCSESSPSEARWFLVVCKQRRFTLGCDNSGALLYCRTWVVRCSTVVRDISASRLNWHDLGGWHCIGGEIVTIVFYTYATHNRVKLGWTSCPIKKVLVDHCWNLLGHFDFTHPYAHPCKCWLTGTLNEGLFTPTVASKLTCILWNLVHDK